MAHTETPLMRQYNEVKSRFADCLLLFRMGDFYELFFNDAIVAAKILDIALTSRNKNDPNPVPMCGVPHHSVTNYIHRLVASGHRVAICEQLENPEDAKGIVKRDVVRVVSPGTRLDPDALEAKAPNFTHAAVVRADAVEWATCDFTTGRFWFGTSPSIGEWLTYAQSQGLAEVLFAENASGENMLSQWRENAPDIFAQTVPAFYFDSSYAADRIREQFDTVSLAAIHPELTESPGPAGALIKYFQETQKASRIPALLKIEHWGHDHSMELDASTIKALELLPSGGRRDVSLLTHLDRTKTAMGGRCLREWVLRPLTHLQKIEQRQNEVEQLLENHAALHPALNEIYDLERLLSRVSLTGGALATGRELLALGHSIESARRLAGLLSQPDLKALLEKALTSEIVELATRTLAAVVEKPPATAREGGLFRKGFRGELDELIELSENGNQWLADFEARERKATGISSLKVRFNRVFGYYIEITKANLASAPPHYIRKQTMVGGERYITEELKKFEEKILTAEKRRSDMEYALFREFCASFTEQGAAISRLARAVARVDVIAALANVAAEHGYIRPKLDESTELDLIEGQHPTVAVMLKRQKPSVAFVPNTVRLAPNKPFLLITGPNMGGKSTVMRQTALIALMAQIGAFVPARSARVGVVDRIFTRVGSADNLAEGASTFMVEMSEMSFILRHATRRSLILIDEIGRGTSTYDGMSLAWALATDIATRIGARALFATHYHELTTLAEKHATVSNARVAVALTKNTTGSTMRFLYRLEPGVAERSYGILVARLAGLPETLLLEAEAMLAQLESKGKSPQLRALKRTAQLSLSLDAEDSPQPPCPTPNPLEEWLQRLELNALTPLQAMLQLAEWKEKVQSSKMKEWSGTKN